MKLYLLEQNKNNGYDHNTYDSCVVVSESEEKAKLIAPYQVESEEDYCWERTWAKSEFIKVTYLGEAESSLKEGSVLCASFHAG